MLRAKPRPRRSSRKQLKRLRKLPQKVKKLKIIHRRQRQLSKKQPRSLKQPGIREFAKILVRSSKPFPKP